MPAEVACDVGPSKVKVEISRNLLVGRGHERAGGGE